MTNIHLASLFTVTTIQPKGASGLGLLALASMLQKRFPLFLLADSLAEASENQFYSRGKQSPTLCPVFFFFFLNRKNEGVGLESGAKDTGSVTSKIN